MIPSDNCSDKRRVGIYGGTFAPPHNGHVRAALAFLTEAKLDVLYIMPAAVPPHKQLTAGDDPEIRLAMTHAAFDGLDPRITVSDYEIRKAGVSYTYETLTHFAQMQENDLFLLCGTDMFLTLDTWRCPEIIFRLATAACIMREDGSAAYDAVLEKSRRYADTYGARTLMIPAEPLELSSSIIRQMVREGRDVSSLVPPAVHRILSAQKLYRGE